MDPDLFLLDPERFRILKFVDPATSGVRDFCKLQSYASIAL